MLLPEQMVLVLELAVTTGAGGLAMVAWVV